MPDVIVFDHDAQFDRIDGDRARADRIARRCDKADILHFIVSAIAIFLLLAAMHEALHHAYEQAIVLIILKIFAIGSDVKLGEYFEGSSQTRNEIARERLTAEARSKIRDADRAARELRELVAEQARTIATLTPTAATASASTDAKRSSSEAKAEAEASADAKL